MAVNSRRIWQRTWGVGVFVLATGIGMHVAGQTAAQPAAPAAHATPPTPAGDMPAPTTSSASAAPQGQGPDAATMQKLAPLINAAGSVPRDKMPAFGPAAIQAAEEIFGSRGDKGAPKEVKPEKFVPSVVEQFSPKKIQQRDPRAVLHTSMGDVTIRLFPNYTPKTVHNFIDLARGDREFLDSKTGKPTRRPFYTELIFHRVLDGFLIQTGCPFGTGHGGPGYFIADEITPALRFNKPGIVAMAPERKDGVTEKKDANGSQFFISLAPMPEWDDKFTIFGEVEKGMKVVEKIAHAQTGPTDRPIKRIYLHTVEIFEDTAPNPAHQDESSNETK